jgi:hypothetical protein
MEMRYTPLNYYIYIPPVSACMYSYISLKYRVAWTCQYALMPDNKKVKLSLCLTKQHAMKTYWGSGSIAPRILDLGTRWKWSA